jgi:mRNA interferase MazF
MVIDPRSEGVIRQGDIFWVDLDEPAGSEPGYPRPYVVVQNNLFNQSRIHTVVMCALTSNLQRAKSPGNVLLEAGEGGLPQPSVVNITQLFTVDKSALGDFSGSLQPKRIVQITEGINLLIQPAETD